ncbi:MAG: tetratricopeptide repeat protein, partial [Acidobacteriota bacterium]|nr:tetratricopeptide repeat protein [Acidobacteriota bacterium]
ELLPDNRIAERAWVLGSLASGNTREVKDWFKQRPQEKLDANLNRLRAIRELTLGNSDAAATLLACPSPAVVAGSFMSDGASGQSGAVGVIREVNRETSVYDRLVCGLAPLAAGDQEGALKRLAELPRRRENVSMAEQVAFALHLFYRGAAHFQAKHFAEAATDFAEAQRLAQSHELKLSWLGRLVPYYHRAAEELFNTDINQAIECWKLVLEIDAKDKAARANLDVARCTEAGRAWHDGRYERAAELWQESLKHHPLDETLLKNTAIGCEKTGHQDQAVTHWRRLVHLWRPQLKSRRDDEQFKKQFLRAEKHLIDLMLETGTPIEDVQKEIDAALKTTPDNKELRRLSVEIYLGRGRPQQALKQLESLERIEGESVELLLLKGVTLGMLNRMKASRQMIERAYEMEPTNLAAQRGYLLVLGEESSEAHDKNQLDVAAKLCERQLEIDPRYRPALTHLACISFHLNDLDKARATIARIIELDPTKAEGHVVAGGLYLEHDKTREAEAEFKKALALNPDADSYRRIGESYLDARKVKKALQNFDRAAATGSFETLMEIAETLHDADKDRDAERFIDLAIIKDPKHPLPHLIKASLHVNRSEMEKASEEMAAVERLGAGKAEFREFVDEARSLRKMLQQMNGLERMLKSVEDMPGSGQMPPELLRLLKQLG